MTTEPMEFLTIKEVAALVKVTPMSVQRWVRQGILPQPRKLGGRVRWCRAELAQCLEDAPRAMTEAPRAA